MPERPTSICGWSWSGTTMKQPFHFRSERAAEWPARSPLSGHCAGDVPRETTTFLYWPEPA